MLSFTCLQLNGNVAVWSLFNTCEERNTMGLVELIARAPWREAVTYRETWPHEYVVIKKDGQRELLAEVCKRFCEGEGVDGYFFFRRMNKYLFIAGLQVLADDALREDRPRQVRLCAEPLSHLPRPPRLSDKTGDDGDGDGAVMCWGSITVPQ